jgi:hypothetical protein
MAKQARRRGTLWRRAVLALAAVLSCADAALAAVKVGRTPHSSSIDD